MHIRPQVIRSYLSQMNAIYYEQDEIGIHTFCRGCKENITFGLIYHFQKFHPDIYTDIEIMDALSGKVLG